MADNIDDISTQIIESYQPGAIDHSDSTESSIRYAAYANRLRTILLASHRYVAYTSDIGESFRPAVTAPLVKACYGISWAYILGDVSFEAWKAKLRQEGRYIPGLKPWDEIPPASIISEKVAEIRDLPDWKLVGLERGLFQSIASMGLPAFTIHSAVKYATNYADKNIKNNLVRRWGPIGLGLAIVPALPYLFDKPVEHVLGSVFEKIHDYNRRQKLEQ
jgi:fission process protein 1